MILEASCFSPYIYRVRQVPDFYQHFCPVLQFKICIAKSTTMLPFAPSPAFTLP